MRRDSRASSPWMKDEAISTISRIEAWKEMKDVEAMKASMKASMKGPKHKLVSAARRVHGEGDAALQVFLTPTTQQPPPRCPQRDSQTTR